MSRIAPTGMSAVRPRVTSELSRDGKPKSDDRGRSRDMSRQTDTSRVSEIPSIRQLRSHFQHDDVPKTDCTDRGTATSTSTVGDIKLHTTTEPHSRRMRTNPEFPIHMQDPEKYFESTNHTQRFQQTRALFAKMEEQTRLDQEQRRQMIHRSKSPTRFPVTSPTSLAIPPETGDANQTWLSPDSEYQSPAAKFTRYGTREQRMDHPRMSSASTDMREMKPVEATVPVQTIRSSSVDRLDDDAPYEPSSLRESAKFSSRSETDLGGSNRDVVSSPKWLMQHYEDVVRKNAAIFGPQVTRRRTRPTENNIRPDGLHKDEADGKLPSIGSQPDADSIPRGSSYVRQNYHDRIRMPASANVTSKYGRVEEKSSTTPELEKQAHSVTALVERQDHDSAARPSRRSVAMDVEDDSVVKSVEAWKTRRRMSNKSDESEKEHAPQVYEEQPSSANDQRTDIADRTETGQSSLMESAQKETSKPTISEPSSIFGVSLRSTSASKVEGEEAKPNNEVGVELETKVPDMGTSVEPHFSEPDVELDVFGELAQPETEMLTDLPTKDADVEVSGTHSSGRRLSIELAEVPHFPKDSVLLTGGHRSLSPRSSADESQLRPPSFTDVKPDDHTEDSVFEKDRTPTEPSVTLLNSCNVPSESAKPETNDVDIPSTDYLPSIETRYLLR